MNMINKLPIAAAVLGLALVFTQSAFKNTTQDPTHYKNSSGNWIPLGSLAPGPNPGMYRCVEAPELTVCTAYFNPLTNPNPQPEDEPTSSDIKDFGRFILNP